jgi:hypothetical protein
MLYTKHLIVSFLDAYETYNYFVGGMWEFLMLRLVVRILTARL